MKKNIFLVVLILVCFSISIESKASNVTWTFDDGTLTVWGGDIKDDAFRYRAQEPKDFLKET